MDDRGNSEGVTDFKAAIDRRVGEALEAEYARERLQGRPAGGTTGRRLVLAGLGMVILAVIATSVLWTRDIGLESAVSNTTTSEAASDTTLPAADAPDVEPLPSETEDFAASLESRGALVTILDPPPEPIGLTGDALHVCLNGTPLHIFEYETVAERQRESDGITSNGRITFARGGEGTLTFDRWAAAPRFFAQGRLIVLALGPDEATLAILTSLLGATLTPDDQGLNEAGSCSP